MIVYVKYLKESTTEITLGINKSRVRLKDTKGNKVSSHENTWRNPKGTSLVVQWLRHRAPNAGDMGLIPGRGTMIPHAMWPN